LWCAATSPASRSAHATSVVVIGGVATSALISLIVIPPLYLVVRSRVQRAPDLGLSQA